jgi:hypothetical protein
MRTSEVKYSRVVLHTVLCGRSTKLHRLAQCPAIFLVDGLFLRPILKINQFEIVLQSPLWTLRLDPDGSGNSTVSQEEWG